MFANVCCGQMDYQGKEAKRAEGATSTGIS